MNYLMRHKKILLYISSCFLALFFGVAFAHFSELKDAVHGIATHVVNQRIPRTDIPLVYNSGVVNAVRDQIGVVIAYDNQYYAGGYPPDDRGACTDVIARALDDLGYDFKNRIDTDMRNNPHVYTREYDANINFRRVNNVEVYLERYAKKLRTGFPEDNSGEKDWSDWLPGDIVTFDQIPGQLWHIAIISDHAAPDGTPLLIHNHGNGTVENNMLTRWPSDIAGRYRFDVSSI